MNLKPLALTSFVAFSSWLNSLTIDPHLYKKNRPNDLLQKMVLNDDFVHSYQGLHSINSYGWYVSNKKTAQKVQFLRPQNSTDAYLKIFFKEHSFLDLALVKFDIKNEKPLRSILLTKIKMQQDCPKNSWVISLAKVPSKNPRSIKYKLPKYNFPLHAISQILEKNEDFLIFYKGDLDDFFKVKTPLLRGKWYQVLDKIFDKVNHSITNDYCEPIFTVVQDHVPQTPLCECNEWDDCTFRSDTQKPYHLYKKESEKEIYIDSQLNILRAIKKGIYNGIADSNDLGGGIYGCPVFFQEGGCVLHQSGFSLIGITTTGGIKGETSVAINLTTPQIKIWMLDNIQEYYQKL